MTDKSHNTYNMSTENTTLIKFLRSSQIYSSLEESIIALNELEHSQGQPVIVYYTSTSLDNNVCCLLSVGKRDGRGKDSYSIVSFGDEIFVNRILINVLPDITEIRPQELFISKLLGDNEIKYYWVYRSGQERVITEIKNNIPIKVKEISSGKEWWVSNSELKETYNFVTKEECNQLLSQTLNNRTRSNNEESLIANLQKRQQESIDKLSKETLPLKLIIEHDLEEVYEAGISRNFSIKVKGEYLGDDVTKLCNWSCVRSSTNRRININEQVFSGDIILENCSQTETFTISMEFPITREVREESITIVFSINTIIGKIKNHVLGYGTNELYYLNSGKNLLGSTDWINAKTIQDAINQENNKKDNLSDKKFILRTENDDVVYRTFLDINEYIFIAIPKEHKPLSDIIDKASGISIIDSFELLDENLDLIRNLNKDNRYLYNVYLKKKGSQSKNKEVIIIFKP